MSERLIVALDGATATCSTALVAAHEGGAKEGTAVLARRSEHNGRGQARILLRLVDEMLEEVDAAPGDLDRIVVGTGPGTFTGVRIAVATARGMSVGLGIPVFGVSTLTALAASAVDRLTKADASAKCSIVPVIDARRQQVFFAVYRPARGKHKDGGPLWVCRKPIGVCEPRGLRRALAGVKGPIQVVGEDLGLEAGLPQRADLVTCDVKAEYLVSTSRLAGGGPVSGTEVAHTCREDEQADSGAPETVRPIYVRAPDADVHITKMKDPWADAGAKR